MDTTFSEPRDCRPLWHYTPPSGWINDPNGLHWDGRAWHLFAQHTPLDPEQGPVPGPMHWLHAISDDLIFWRDLGLAISPDELGIIYSGSAVTGQGRTAAFFTHHGETEQQSVAFSEDGIHFKKYAGNPVIANPGLRDFRDPKVFPNEVLGGWSMVLAAGDALLFYHSDDLLRWEKTGTFGRAENRMGGIFECPDLFALPAPNGKTLWVLTASMGLPAIEGGGKMQYFLGEFDGRVFQQTILAAEPLLLDAGQDNYAAVTFFGAEPTQIGWAGNWAYAARIPAANWRGCMTLARRLSLAQTRQGLRLAAQPVLPALRTLGEVKGAARLPGETFVLDLKAQGDFEAAFSNGAGERLAFGCDGGVFFIDRESTGHLPYPRAEQPRLMEGPIHMRAVFDRSVIEIFADGGVYAGSALVFPAQPYDALELRGATGMLQV